MQIINSTDINVNGTSKQSTFRATYWELVEAFGQPTYRGPEYLDDKLNVEWVLQVDGEPATIYDWKSSIAPEDNSTWNIGGFTHAAAWKIIDILNKKEVA